MQYKYVYVDSLLNKIVRKDNFFLGDYTVDPYINCEFGCLYCDSSLDKKIIIKSNAAEILDKELNKNKKGTIIVGSVHDPYQKIEKKQCVTKDILNVIKKHDFGCHILTKSDLVLRDIHILKKIKKCRVTISITSLNKANSNFFEENVIPPEKRLKIVKKLNENNIKSGIALLPVLPLIVENDFEKIIKSAKNNSADYIVFKHLELKGDQKTFFINELKKFKPEFLEKYEELYKNNYSPDKKFIEKIHKDISRLCKRYKIKNKILKK